MTEGANKTADETTEKKAAPAETDADASEHHAGKDLPLWNSREANGGIPKDLRWGDEFCC